MKPLPCLAAIVLGALALAVGVPARAEAGTGGQAGVSHTAACTLKVHRASLNGKPGEKLFLDGAKALREGDHRHAIYMYKVAASWGYKAAEYDLGLIYYRGEHVPADRPLGTAWMVLAAQRGKSPLYTRARDLMVTSLTDAQFKRMRALWNKLKKTYGDKVALPRLRLFAGWVAAQDNIGSHLADGFDGGEASVVKVGPGGALAWMPKAAADSASSNAWLWQKMPPRRYRAR